MENKKEFVKEYGELVAKHNINNITKMEYVEDENGDEWCVVYYTGGHSRKICVTADSLWCILVDTVQQL